LNSKQADILATARININRLARIISDLLDVSKMESGKLNIKKNEVDLLSLAHHVITLFEPTAKAKGLMIEKEFFSAPILVMADGDMLVQVFTNLLDNAIKFTEKGYVGIKIQTKDGSVECTVYDSGIGISKQNLPKVFNKFEQFRRTIGAGGKGTGLGLFIVKGIIEAHGGNIWAESTYGKGSSFTFVLPKI
jgi:signal transduction histidine kinase